MYKDQEQQRKANRERVRRYREKGKGVTSPPQGVTLSASEGVTEGVTSGQGVTQGVTYRLNPRDGRPYGPGMLGLPAWALAEYERKYGQLEPVYGSGNASESLAEYALSDKFQRIHTSLGPYAGDVRVGCYGPTVEELYQAVHGAPK